MVAQVAGVVPQYDRGAFRVRPEPVGVLEPATGAVGIVRWHLGPLAWVEWTDGRRAWHALQRGGRLRKLSPFESWCLGDAPVPVDTPAWTCSVHWHNGNLPDTRQYRWRPVPCLACGQTALRRVVEGAWGWDGVVEDDGRVLARMEHYRCCAGAAGSGDAAVTATNEGGRA